MKPSFPSTLNRRQCLAALAGGVAFGKLALSGQTPPRQSGSSLGMPGLRPGRVAAIEHPDCFVDEAFQAGPIREMMERGMRVLTGAPDPASAWKMFFEPGDVVGIKVNPVGGPAVISCPEVLHQIIAGLESAGVRRRDIVVYDRYRAQFLNMGFDKWLPDGVRWSAACEDYDPIQQDMDGYDPEHYVDFPATLPDYDLNDERARRSYAAKFITQEVDKLINLPVLKDHQSAGVTLALKNLSHGLVNNVSRSHSSKTLNVCGSFIPAVVSMPVIRNKTVLHILDGIKGLYHGGPSARAQFVWPHRTLYFATDPVALDHVGWQVIDAKRVEEGMKPLLEAGPDAFTSFVHRQPEHVEIAGALGLGVWEDQKIQLRRFKLKA